MTGGRGTGRLVKTSGVEECCAGEGATVASGEAEGAAGEAEGAVGATAVGTTAVGAAAVGETPGAGVPDVGVGDAAGAGVPTTRGGPDVGCTMGARDSATVTARVRAAGANAVPVGKDCTGPMGAGTKSV